MATPLNIIARKPKDTEGNEYVVVNRGGDSMPFVSATANAHSLTHRQWFWGYYFATEAEALAHFNAR